MAGKFPRALLLSVLLHLFILGLIVSDLTFFDPPKMIQAGPPVKTIKAKIVDLKQLEAVQREKKELEARRKQEQEKKKKALAAKKRAEQKKKQDAQKKRKAEKARKAEEKRKNQAAEKKKQQALKLKTAEKKKAEAKRKAEHAAKIEVQRKAEEARKAEEKRVTEEARRKQAEQRRLAEEEKRRKQANLKAKLQAEENQRRLSRLRQDYILAIRQKVERNWRKPAGSGKMPLCEVHVTQGPSGIVLEIAFGACPGSTATYRNSIENAVRKADPLPAPGDPALFERKLKFLFKPTE